MIGESPLRVCRDLRGLAQAPAEKAAVNRVTIAEIEIETGRKRGSVATLCVLAGVPGIMRNDLAK